jgi:hypothetical protein
MLRFIQALFSADTKLFGIVLNNFYTRRMKHDNITGAGDAKTG